MENITGSCFSLTYSFVLFPTVLFLTSILRYALPLCKHLQASVPQVLNLPLFPLLCTKAEGMSEAKGKVCCFSAQSSIVAAAVAAAPRYGVQAAAGGAPGAGCSHAVGSPPDFQLLNRIKRS